MDVRRLPRGVTGSLARAKGRGLLWRWSAALERARLGSARVGEDGFEARAEVEARLKRDPSAWALDATSPAAAVANMEMLDAIYTKSGLGLRG